MYKLIFPNGNEQTFESFSQMNEAARLLGGEAKRISAQMYAFVPKK